MYPAANTLMEQVTADISATEQVIPVTDLTAFPDGPNYVTIGTENDAEVILYSGKNAALSSLTGCLRGQSGTVAHTWDTGEYIYHSFTSSSYNAFKDNIKGLDARVDNHTQPAESITFVPPSGMSAVNVQAALVELYARMQSEAPTESIGTFNHGLNKNVAVYAMVAITNGAGMQPFGDGAFGVTANRNVAVSWSIISRNEIEIFVIPELYSDDYSWSGAIDGREGEYLLVSERLNRSLLLILK